MSSGGHASSVTSGRTRRPPVATIGPDRSATRNTSNGEGSSRRRSSCNRVTEKTSKGPQKSSTSTSGKTTMPTVLRFTAFSSPSGGAETVTVVSGIHAHGSKERAPHDLGAAEAAFVGDGVDAERRLLQSLARGFDAGALDEPGRRHAHLACEHAGEVPRTHRCSARQRPDREIRRGMLADPHLKLSDRLVSGRLGRQRHTELRLATGALHEHHELSSHGQRDL